MLKRINLITGIVGLLTLIVGMGIYFLTGGTLEQTAKLLVVSGLVLLTIFGLMQTVSAAQLLSRRNAALGMNALVYTLVTLGVIILVNVIAVNKYWRWDSTSSGMFSLSQQTISRVSALKDAIEITYWGKETDAGYIPAKDMLESYRTLSSKLSVRFRDPDKDPQEATALGVRQMGTLTLKSPTHTVQVEQVSEDGLTNGLIRATKEGRKKVLFLKGNAERLLSEAGADGLAQFKKGLEDDNYTIDELSLFETHHVPSDCNVLVIWGPKLQVSKGEMDMVRAFLLAGSGVVIALDPADPREPTRPAVDLNDGISDFGIRVENNLVVDVSGTGQMLGANEYMPIGMTTGDHAITKGLQTGFVIMPFARSVDFVPQKTGAMGVEGKVLLKTLEQAWGETQLKADTPPEYNAGVDLRGPVPMAVAAVKGKSRLVVFGSSSFATNSVFNVGNNRDMALNTINWLSSDEDQISIRPKDPEDRRIELTQRGSIGALMLTVVLLPLAWLIAGLVVWFRRRQS